MCGAQNLISLALGALSVGENRKNTYSELGLSVSGLALDGGTGSLIVVVVGDEGTFVKFKEGGGACLLCADLGDEGREDDVVGLGLEEEMCVLAEVGGVEVGEDDLNNDILIKYYHWGKNKQIYDMEEGSEKQIWVTSQGMLP